MVYLRLQSEWRITGFYAAIIIMKKTFFIPLFLLILVSAAAISAHGPDEFFDVYALLEVEEPALLPDSPFYFLKSLGRGFKMFFTFDAAKKAELELKFLDEKLAEMHKLFEKTDDRPALELAFQNYLRSHERLRARLEALRDKNKNVDFLLDKLAARVVDHQKLFDELEEKLGEKIDKAVEELAKGAKEALELDREKFKEKLKEKIRKERGDDLENLEALEKLEEFDKELEEELESLEEELKGIFEGARENAEDAINDAQEKSIEVEQKLARLTDEEIKKNVGALLENAKKKLSEAEAAFAEEKYGMALGLARAAEATAESAKRALELEEILDENPEDLEKGLEDLDKIEKEIRDSDYEKKVRDLKECGPMPGAPGNWVCEDGQWVNKGLGRVCIQLYDPVCGVDGKTYSNDCFARAAGVAVKHKGECVAPAEQTAPTPPPTITPLPSTTSLSSQFEIEADDNGFYPASPIAVEKGTKVKIVFKVRSSGVYFGGLDFRSTKFKTAAIPPGGSTTVEFIADESFTITSYWPASGVKKADLRIEVK